MNSIGFPLAMLAGTLAQNAFAQARPNVILIMTDQQRFDAIGYANGQVQTPNLDQMAHEGTIFSEAYTCSPSSTPARSVLLTGLTPWHNGLLGYSSAMGTHYRQELPRMMKDEGYFTYAIGKNHYHPQREPHGYMDVLLDESGRREDENFISDYRSWFMLNAPSKDPDATGLDWNGHGAREYALAERLHPTAWTGQMACELIGNYDSEKPLFLKVSFARPHSPYDPPQKYVQMYDNRSISAPVTGDWEGEWARPVDPDTASVSAPFANFGPDYAIRSRRHYYANISFIDEEVGRIIKALKDKGMYDNSLILFVSDHGDMMGDHYHWRKSYPFEGSAHVPMFIKWPSSYHMGGTVIDRPCGLRDIMPTFLEAASARIPDDIDGSSLLSLARDPGRSWRKYMEIEHSACYSPENHWCGVTDGKMKYVWYFPTGKEMFFDLVQDPGERHNAIGERKYRKAIEEMRSYLASYLEERGETFVKDGRLQKRGDLLYSPNFPDAHQ